MGEMRLPRKWSLQGVVSSRSSFPLTQFISCLRALDDSVEHPSKASYSRGNVVSTNSCPSLVQGCFWGSTNHLPFLFCPVRGLIEDKQLDQALPKEVQVFPFKATGPLLTAMVSSKSVWVGHRQHPLQILNQKQKTKQKSHK